VKQTGHREGPEKRARDTRRGYALAAANMAVSGVAIFVNSIGVKMFEDSTLFTALKNLFVGAVLLVPFVLSPRARAGLKVEGTGRLLLLLVALIGGSVPYALYFRGLQLSTPVTAALIDHLQFLLVAVFAAAFLGERFGAGVWTGLVVLLAGLSLGVSAGAVRLDAGSIYLGAATALFAADFALMKYLLRSVAPLTVMTAKMGLGSLLLVAYVAASGRLGAVASLTALQWGFVLVTGLILLAFTATSVLGLRLASATAVTAIPAGAPLITTALVVISRRAAVPPLRWLGLALVLLGVAAVFLLGSRQERRAAASAAGGEAA
jgi:drug/metabolite transporter (DMT)-like permease